MINSYPSNRTALPLKSSQHHHHSGPGKLESYTNRSYHVVYVFCMTMRGQQLASLIMLYVHCISLKKWNMLETVGTIWKYLEHVGTYMKLYEHITYIRAGQCWTMGYRKIWKICKDLRWFDIIWMWHSLLSSVGTLSGFIWGNLGQKCLVAFVWQGGGGR